MQKKKKKTSFKEKTYSYKHFIAEQKKLCPFKEAGIDRIDYKDVELLKDYVTQGGKIIPSRISGVCSSNQRKLKIAVRRARNIALLSPMKGYVPQQSNADRRFSLKNTSIAEARNEVDTSPENQESINIQT